MSGYGLLEGQVCLVTGAGRGIGKATASLFAREGGIMIDTDMFRSVGEEHMEERLRLIGMNRLGTPEDVAKARWYNISI